jgi:hypothetical protein
MGEIEKTIVLEDQPSRSSLGSDDLLALIDALQADTLTSS